MVPDRDLTQSNYNQFCFRFGSELRPALAVSLPRVARRFVRPVDLCGLVFCTQHCRTVDSLLPVIYILHRCAGDPSLPASHIPRRCSGAFSCTTPLSLAASTSIRLSDQMADDSPILVAHFAPMLLPLKRGLEQYRCHDVRIIPDPEFGMPSRRDLPALLLCVDAALRRQRVTPRSPVKVKSLRKVAGLRLAVDHHQALSVLAGAPVEMPSTNIIRIASEFTETDIELSAEWIAFCAAARSCELPWEELTALSPGVLSLAIALATADQDELDLPQIAFRAGGLTSDKHALTRRFKQWFGELSKSEEFKHLGSLEGSSRGGWVITAQPVNVRSCSGISPEDQQRCERSGMTTNTLPQRSLLEWYEELVTGLSVVVPSPHLAHEDRHTGEEHNLQALQDALKNATRDPVNAEYAAKIGALLDTYMRVVGMNHHLLDAFREALGVAQAVHETMGELHVLYPIENEGHDGLVDMTAIDPDVTAVETPSSRRHHAGALAKQGVGRASGLPLPLAAPMDTGPIVSTVPVDADAPLAVPISDDDEPVRPWRRGVPAAVSAVVMLAACVTLWVMTRGDTTQARADIPALPLATETVDVCEQNTAPSVSPLQDYAPATTGPPSSPASLRRTEHADCGVECLRGTRDASNSQARQQSTSCSR